MKIADSYFVISNLENVDIYKDKLYGFQLLRRNKVIAGHFVEIKNKLNTIELSVDPHGMGRLYCYKAGSIWAISNSFYGLYSYLQMKALKRTVNQEYIDLFIKTSPITTVSYSDTYFNEINLLPANVIIKIHKSEKTLTFDTRKEINFVEIGSQHFFDYINAWEEKWFNILEFVEKKHTLNAQLSGGFDSRLSFSLLLKKHTDFKNINVESSTRMQEDFAIAEKIANFYRFDLNNGIPIESERLDSYNSYILNLIHRLSVHKQLLPSLHYRIYSQPLFHLTGYGNMRGWFNADSSTYIEYLLTKNSEKIYDENLANSIDRILKKSYVEVESRTSNQLKQGPNFLNYVYNYTRGRYNYGSSVMCAASVNQYILAPILDLQHIKPISSGNSDFNLLFTYLYLRNAPELIDYPFSQKRKISEDCIKAAKTLIDLSVANYSYENWSDEIALKTGDVISTGKNNPFKVRVNPKDHIRMEVGFSENIDLIQRETSSEFIEDLKNDLNGDNELRAFGALSMILLREFV